MLRMSERAQWRRLHEAKRTSWLHWLRCCFQQSELALDRERLKWLVLVVFRVEKVDHLVQDLKRVCTLALIFLLVHTNRLVVRSHEETGKELSHVVKAGSLAPIELDQTLFLLVFPDSRRAIEGHTQERSILRI